MVEIEAGEWLRAITTSIDEVEASSCCGRVGSRRIGVSVEGGDGGKGRSRICAEDKSIREGTSVSLTCEGRNSVLLL
jgi:hypothetical protein